MTAPVRLPHVSSGNLLTDVSTAGAALAQGLQAENTRRREDAMKEALLAVQQLNAQAALQRALRGERPAHIIAQTPEGLRHAFADPFSGKTNITDVAAPESQYFFQTETPEGALGIGAVSRNRPGTPATSVPMPSGQQPRDVAPVPMTVETPQGPQVVRVPRREGPATPVATQSGETLQPRAQQFEVEKAQFAVNMKRAAAGMENVVNTTPQAVDEAVQRLNVQGVLQSLPVIGAPAGEIAQRAIALGISPEAANWLANFYTFIGFAVPELAGKQMTITEMRQQIAMFAPLIGEPESARRIKRENVMFRVESAMRAAGSGMTRVGQPELPQAPKQSKYGYTKPQ